MQLLLAKCASTLFNLKDHLYFNDDTSDAQAQTQIVAPSQYDGTVNYFSAKISREFIFWKICFRQHHFVSKVIQQNAVLNLPEL
jgi:hypothetical protein